MFAKCDTKWYYQNMVRIEINKKQLVRNFVDAFFYASWLYMAMFVVGAAVGAVGLVFGIGKNTYTLAIGVAALVLAVLALLLCAFQCGSIYLVFLGKFKESYPNGVKIFEIERLADGFEINNVVVRSKATLHFYNIAKIAKTKNTIIIRLKRGTVFGFPRTDELDAIFTN